MSKPKPRAWKMRIEVVCINGYISRIFYNDNLEQQIDGPLTFVKREAREIGRVIRDAMKEYERSKHENG